MEHSLHELNRINLLELPTSLFLPRWYEKIFLYDTFIFQKNKATNKKRSRALTNWATFPIYSLCFSLWKRRDSNPRPRRNERSNAILRHLLFLIQIRQQAKRVCSFSWAPLLPILGSEPAILHLLETCVFLRKLLPSWFSTQPH